MQKQEKCSYFREKCHSFLEISKFLFACGRLKRVFEG